MKTSIKLLLVITALGVVTLLGFGTLVYAGGGHQNIMRGATDFAVTSDRATFQDDGAQYRFFNHTGKSGFCNKDDSGSTGDDV
jgi:hypothetical protein